MTTKILVIEDADALRNDILEMLSFEGFDVSGAGNGRLGVEEARRYRPDLIICDIMMPELDGYGVLQELQKDGIGVTTPFIFLTARTDKGDIRQGMSSGADDYLTKPFTANELIASVRKRLEKREQVKQVSERKMENLRENIILSLPHEIRTPLTGILGFSDILMTDCHFMEPDKVAEMAQYVYTAAQRLYRLTENYLVYAQLELVTADAKRVEAMRQSTTPHPRAVIEDAAIQKAQNFQREADLKLSVKNDEVTVAILEDNLKRVIDELVDNAFKFSQSGKPVVLNAEVVKDQYVITIDDQGRGMSRDQLGEIGAFSQFERKLYEQQGSGFGLMITKKSIELHGGDFNVESEVGKGTRVTIRLPLAPAQELAPAF